MFREGLTEKVALDLRSEGVTREDVGGKIAPEEQAVGAKALWQKLAWWAPEQRGQCGWSSVSEVVGKGRGDCSGYREPCKSLSGTWILF